MPRLPCLKAGLLGCPPPRSLPLPSLKGDCAHVGLTMSPQVKVYYFGQHQDGALGHSVLYLTGVGKYQLLAPGMSPRPSVLPSGGC